MLALTGFAAGAMNYGACLSGCGGYVEYIYLFNVANHMGLCTSIIVRFQLFGLAATLWSHFQI